MIDQLLAAVDAQCGEPLDDSQRTHLSVAFARILNRSPVTQVCEAIDQLKARGIGVTAVKCGGLELALFQLHAPGKPTAEPGEEDDPLFDAVR